ncbi:hypothetical protein AVEN_251438-1 [Araneus ventricosus]|uniref:Uncharacterized protein n=1 Tax=Araneus ventricosus TaxID=182803 RepID=A0A4Y2R129_ARAVE|nr:hypothetical protein AVEN_251438-1 [Araneus ventricosus]
MSEHMFLYFIVLGESFWTNITSERCSTGVYIILLFQIMLGSKFNRRHREIALIEMQWGRANNCKVVIYGTSTEKLRFLCLEVPFAADSSWFLRKSVKFDAN